jgi:hypothetical protein
MLASFKMHRSLKTHESLVNSESGRLSILLLTVIAFLLLGMSSARLSGQDQAVETSTISLEDLFEGPRPSGSCSGNERITAPSGLPAVDDFVELRRSTCYGRCPAYTVRVRADGKVTWSGRAFVAKVGEDTATISPDQARALIEKFRNTEVWSLCSDYSRAVTDSSSAKTRLRIGNMEKEIDDYAHSAPAWFIELRDQIDSIAGTRRWIDRDPRTEVFALIPARDSTGLFPEYSALPIISLADATFERAGVTSLMHASIFGDLEAVESLIANKADLNTRDAGGWTALMYAAGSETEHGTSIMQKLLAAGADPKARTAMGQTPMMAAVGISHYLKERVRNLQQAGGDINAQDSNGQTALMFAAEHILGWDSRETTFRERMENLTYLRTIGSRADLEDKWGRTALDQIEEQAGIRASSGKQFDLVTRILHDLIPGNFPPVNIAGRVVASQNGDVTPSAVTIDRVGEGFQPEEAPLSADGTFKFSNLNQGVYRLRLKPSPTINPPEVTISVRNADLSDIEILNPGLHEVIVRVFVEKGLPPPALGLIIENSIMGSIIGKPPEIAISDNSRSFPTNILSAIASHGRSANVRLVALEPHGLKDPLAGLYLPEPFERQDVPSLEEVSDGYSVWFCRLVNIRSGC